MPFLFAEDWGQMLVDYDYRRNAHTLTGAAAALSAILGDWRPASLLDIGCGPGTWLRAAADLGIPELQGVDGVALSQEELLVSKEIVRVFDLSEPFSFGRRFDVLLCLEVAEHLPEHSAESLVASIAAHADTVYFGAACPGQPGQHHVNCQWPDYWQRLFNQNGFACDDSVRWRIWDDERIEPWYRQNLFLAKRAEGLAGREPRIKSVVHPDLLETLYGALDSRVLAWAEGGALPMPWYLKAAPRAFFAKLRKRWSS